mmetsp:Transcript_44311/g.71239  ORF Transcript_44311/g.71239 Transcript_44311/m.71239 type:complete len:325 (+) Transcript_44311:204-1178(+)
MFGCVSSKTPEGPYRYVEKNNTVLDKWGQAISFQNEGLVPIFNYIRQTPEYKDTLLAIVGTYFEERKGSWIVDVLDQLQVAPNVSASFCVHHVQLHEQDSVQAYAALRSLINVEDSRVLFFTGSREMAECAEAVGCYSAFAEYELNTSKFRAETLLYRRDHGDDLDSSSSLSSAEDGEEEVKKKEKHEKFKLAPTRLIFGAEEYLNGSKIPEIEGWTEDEIVMTPEKTALMEKFVSRLERGGTWDGDSDSEEARQAMRNRVTLEQLQKKVQPAAEAAGRAARAARTHRTDTSGYMSANSASSSHVGSSRTAPRSRASSRMNNAS